jgi:O-antigen/teichoic acid export membrane protein
LIYHGKREPAALRELFTAAVWLGLLLSVPAALCGWWLIPRWMSLYPAESVRFAQASLALMPLALLTEIAIGAFRAREQFARYNRLRVLPPLLTLAGYGLLLANETMTPAHAAVATFIACSLIGLWFVGHHLATLRLQFGNPLPAMRKLLAYGWRSSGSDILSNLMLQVDALLVIALLSPAQMGLYTVALSLARILNIFQSAVVNVLFPKTADRPMPEVLDATGRAVRTGTLAAGGAACVIALAAEPLLHFLYGAEFVAAVAVMRWLLADAVVSCAAMILMQSFLALARPGVVSLLQGAGLALACVSLWFFIPRFGLAGTGYALLVANLVRFGLVLASYRCFLHTPPPRWWFNRSDALMAWQCAWSSPRRVAAVDFSRG